MTSEPVSYRRHRFPAAIISYAVWLYHVFSLSLRACQRVPGLAAGELALDSARVSSS
ncbi:MAG: hypothetical protein JO227_05975 [Acetobacteraceae bacterium]|nr:hypothetical protein [Acetobacteraceae bacterium]